MGNKIKGNETPNLEQILQTAIEGRLVDFHTMLPGEIVSYDPAKKKASVKIVLKRKYAADGSVKELPVIPSVPVVHPRTKDAIIHLPVKAGDKCMVLFAERSLDIWKKFGGTVDPQDARKFHLSDAVAVPGLYSFADAIEVDKPDALTIKNDQGVIEVFADGKFLFRGPTDEILDLLIQITEKISETEQKLVEATTNTIFGAIQLNNFAQFATLKIQVDQLKTRLEALKGG